MIPRAELEAALLAIEAAAPPAFTASDLTERVAADRVAAGKAAIDPDELHEACRVFLGRKYGFANAADHEADVQQRIAEAKREGTDEALLRLADELTAEGRRHGAQADLLHVEVIKRRAH